jgi:hypothetical protein
MKQNHIAIERALIAFERQSIFALLFDDLGDDRALATVERIGVSLWCLSKSAF